MSLFSQGGEQSSISVATGEFSSLVLLTSSHTVTPLRSLWQAGSRNTVTAMGK